MIKVKTISVISIHGDTDPLDMAVNEFIQRHPGLEIIDVKLTVADVPTAMNYYQASGMHVCIYYAMITYKIKKRNE